MCRYGMHSKDEQGIGMVKKPTGFLSNSEFVRTQLQNKCLGGHRHIALLGGKARACQVYPDKLCRAMLKGIRDELVHSGIIGSQSDDMLMVNPEDSWWKLAAQRWRSSSSTRRTQKDRSNNVSKSQANSQSAANESTLIKETPRTQIIDPDWWHKKSRETTMKTFLPRRHHWKRTSACSPWRSPASPGGVVR